MEATAAQQESAAPQYFTVQQVHQKIGWSEKVVRRLFKDDPDVLKLPGPGIYTGEATHAHITLKIPQISIDRMVARLTAPPPKPAKAFSRPERTIRRIPRAK